MPMHTPLSHTAVVAAEYEQRLSRLLAERFGAGEGGFARGADRAAHYLPNDLALRLRQLMVDLVAIRSGQAEVDNIEKFRASADAVIAAVAAALPSGKSHGRRGSPRRAVFWHLLVALVAPFVVLSLNYVLKMHAPLLVSVFLFWAWGGYLYWVIDRIVKLSLPPSVTRGGLRTFVAVLFFWCPAALGWAVLRFVDWWRRRASRGGGYTGSNDWDWKPITSRDSDAESIYIQDGELTLTPAPLKAPTPFNQS